MRRALAEFRIEGPGLRTTTELLREVLADPDFLAARHATDFMDRFRPAGAAGAE
jgi:acetyl-CoA carboxylase biotin carboxylase subunit